LLFYSYPAPRTGGLPVDARVRPGPEFAPLDPRPLFRRPQDHLRDEIARAKELLREKGLEF